MGVLSGRQIKGLRETGRIVIEPFDPEKVNGASVDVTLGPFFYRINKDRLGTFNPYDQASVDRHFGEPIRRASTLVLAPGERVLGHTDEFIGFRHGGTTQMAARSTWGRNGISVCLCAGWGDPGYFNRWTMEIQNHNRQPTVLKVGTRIAQIVFHAMDDEKVTGYEEDGKYQTSRHISELVKSWVPSMMLPRAFED
jgi:dCTP deaminase